MKPKTVYIAFGSNKGNCIENIKAAIAALAEFGKVTAVSPLFKTKPEGYLEQEDFINGALAFSTSLSPQELLKELKNIEAVLGRKPTFRNAPREIDLDIIFYEDTVISSPELTIPHPLCHKREFVLLPLSLIAADFVHPIQKETVKQLLARLKAQKRVSDCIRLNDNLL